MSGGRILIVDDEPGIRQIISEILHEEGYETYEAENGRSAKDIAMAKKPTMILSDVKMPEVNGIELLHWNNTNTKLPLVLMTGFADLVEISEALELGAEELIRKPFDPQELVDITCKVHKENPVSIDALRDFDFCKIDIDKFTSGSQIPCSIFVRIKKDHYVKLANKGDAIPKDSIKRYKEKNLKFLHVLKSEYKEFVGFNFGILKALEGNKEISREKVNNFINYSSSVVLEKAVKTELDKETFEEIKEYAQLALNILTTDSKMTSLLMSFKDFSEEIYSHSLCVASLSYLMAKKAGWHNDQTLFKVFMAGLLHDIGLKEVPKEIIDKDRILLTPDEVSIIESHTTRGMEILNSLESVQEDVILAAYQHHEDNVGQGYPLGLNKNTISPISKLIKVADIVDDSLVQSKGYKLSQYRTAIEKIEKFKAAQYEREFLDYLKEILKMD